MKGVVYHFVAIFSLIKKTGHF